MELIETTFILAYLVSSLLVVLTFALELEFKKCKFIKNLFIFESYFILILSVCKLALSCKAQ